MMKFWFPDLGIADFESPGPQLFKNQLFKKIKNPNKKYLKKNPIQKIFQKILSTISQQPSTINHHIYIYIYTIPLFSHNTCFVGLLNFSPATHKASILKMRSKSRPLPPGPRQDIPLHCGKYIVRAFPRSHFRQYEFFSFKTFPKIFHIFSKF